MRTNFKRNNASEYIKKVYAIHPEWVVRYLEQHTEKVAKEIGETWRLGDNNAITVYPDGNVWCFSDALPMEGHAWSIIDLIMHFENKEFSDALDSAKQYAKSYNDGKEPRVSDEKLNESTKKAKKIREIKGQGVKDMIETILDCCRDQLLRFPVDKRGVGYNIFGKRGILFTSLPNDAQASVSFLDTDIGLMWNGKELAKKANFDEDVTFKFLYKKNTIIFYAPDRQGIKMMRFDPDTGKRDRNDRYAISVLGMWSCPYVPQNIPKDAKHIWFVESEMDALILSGCGVWASADKEPNKHKWLYPNEAVFHLLYDKDEAGDKYTHGCRRLLTDQGSEWTNSPVKMIDERSILEDYNDVGDLWSAWMNGDLTKWKANTQELGNILKIHEKRSEQMVQTWILAHDANPSDALRDWLVKHTDKMQVTMLELGGRKELKLDNGKSIFYLDSAYIRFKCPICGQNTCTYKARAFIYPAEPSMNMTPCGIDEGHLTCESVKCESYMVDELHELILSKLIEAGYKEPWYMHIGKYWKDQKGQRSGYEPNAKVIGEFLRGNEQFQLAYDRSCGILVKRGDNEYEKFHPDRMLSRFSENATESDIIGNPKTAIKDNILRIAEETPVNLLKDFVNGLVDECPVLGTDHIDRFMDEILHVDSPDNQHKDYYRALSRYWWAAYYARLTTDNGIVLKIIPTLISTESTGKNGFANLMAFQGYEDKLPKALKLGGGEGLLGRVTFCSGTDENKKTREMVYSTRGRAVALIPELGGLSNADAEMVKEWVTQPSDEYNDKWALGNEIVIRHWFPIMTGNRKQFLTENIGKTRFAPIYLKSSEDLGKGQHVATIEFELFQEWLIPLLKEGRDLLMKVGEGDPQKGVWKLQEDVHALNTAAVEEATLEDPLLVVLQDFIVLSRERTFSSSEALQFVKDHGIPSATIKKVTSKLRELGALMSHSSRGNLWMVPCEDPIKPETPKVLTEKEAEDLLNNFVN